MNSSAHTCKFRASFSLAASILCWCSIPLFLRSFIHEIDAWVANGVRYPFAAILWSIPLLIFIRQDKVKAQYFRLALIPAGINIIGQALWAWAPYYLEPAMIMVMLRLSIVFALLGSFAVFPDERALTRSKAFWAGIFLCVTSFTGIILMGEKLLFEGNWKGILIMLGCTLFYGLYGVAVRYCLRGIKPWISFPIISIYTSVVLILFMFLFGEPGDIVQISGSKLALLAVSSVFGIALGHIFYYYAIEHIGVSICSGCQFINPFITAVASYFIFGEIFTPAQTMFGVTLIGGAGLLLSAQRHLGQKHNPQ